MMTRGGQERANLGPQNSRRRLNVHLDPENPKKVIIEVFLRSVDEAATFITGARASKRSTSYKLIPVMKEIANVKSKTRSRTGYLQPNIPKSLSDQFGNLARVNGYRGRSTLLEQYLTRWIDPTSGERLKNDRNHRKRPGGDFAPRGRELIKKAKLGVDGESLIRYTFDAEKSKRGIRKLTKAIGITYSEFFTALISRVCADLQATTQKSEMNA